MTKRAQVPNWDVAIVGTGPAGMFCALELSRLSPKIRIVMFEKGPVREFRDRDNKTCGWGGAGAFSDGKLDLSSEVGGNLSQFLSAEEFQPLMKEVEATYVSYCDSGESQVVVEPDPEETEKLVRKAFEHNLQLVPFPVRHLGTDRAYNIVTQIRNTLRGADVSIFTDSEVIRVEPVNRKGFHLIIKCGNEEEKTVFAKKIVIATGREGDNWLWNEATRLGLVVNRNQVDIGVRVETRAKILNPLTDILHEPKIFYETPCHGDRARTFCVCPNGRVVVERYRGLGVLTVNGESDSKNGVRTPNTNFAILISQGFTEPFNDPNAYAARVAGLANLLAGGQGVIVQRYIDIKRHRRTSEKLMARSQRDGFIEPTLKEAVPGDLSLAIPARQWCCIMAMIEALNEMVPGIAGPHTLFYGPEVKFYSNQFECRTPFETSISGLYVAGDGSGKTRGLLQSSMMGVIVARDIAKKFS